MKLEDRMNTLIWQLSARSDGICEGIEIWSYAHGFTPRSGRDCVALAVAEATFSKEALSFGLDS
jgi:hypothetical protein